MKKLVFTALLHFPILAYCGGFQLNVQGIKAIAMGGAFTGVGSDASTVFFNPAAMCNLSGHNFTMGANFIDPHVSIQTPEVANTDQTSGVGTPIQFYYSGQLSEKVNVGFLVNNQFGSASSFEDTWQGRNIIQNIALTTFMFQPSVSYKLHDKISLGAGIVYSIGSFSIEKAVPLSSASTDEGKARLEGSGASFGYNLGLYSQFLSLGSDEKKTNFSVGINYRSALPIELSGGEATFTNIPASLADKFPSKTSFSSKITLPSVLTFGLSIKHIKSDDWSLEFAYDLNLTGWSSYDTLAFDFENPDTPDSKQIQDWENVLTHRLGLDFTYKNKYSVRAGLYYDNTPMKDHLISPHLPGVSQIAYTAGFGYKINDKFSFDLSYIRQNASRDDVSITSYTFENGLQTETGTFPYKFNRKANVYGVAINYRFGATSKNENVETIE